MNQEQRFAVQHLAGQALHKPPRKKSPGHDSVASAVAEQELAAGPREERENAVLDSEDWGSGLAAISQSPDGKFIVVGGRDVLSVVSMEAMNSKGGQFGDVFNVRKGNTKHKYHIQDVRWHPKRMDYIASAASNGTLVLWNVNNAPAGRGGGDQQHKRSAVIWESYRHQRTVWRLAWCEPVGMETMMLSGSLDGTIRMWDFRTPDKERTTMNMSKNAQTEFVRDLRVCGAEPWKIAAGLECGNEGAIVLWDVRKPDSPLMRIKEETAVHAVDWHPAYPTILASGRCARPPATGCVKVWDTAEEQPSPLAMIPTADGVSNIMWRPTYRTHLATTYMKYLSAIHVWDIMSYRTPLAVCGQHSQPATDIVWQDAHILHNPKNNADDVGWLLSVSKDGTARRSHIENAYLPFLHMRNSTFSQDPEGNFLSSHAPINRSRAQLHNKAPTQPPSSKKSTSLQTSLQSFKCVALGRPPLESVLPRGDTATRKLSGPERKSSLPHETQINNPQTRDMSEEDTLVVVGSTFRTLARVYEFDGCKTVVDLFRSNKAQCDSLGLRKRSGAWDFLACLYDESGEGEGLVQEGSGSVDSESSHLFGRRLSFSTGGGLVQELQGDGDGGSTFDRTFDGVLSSKVFSVGLGPASTPELVASLVSGLIWHSVTEGDVQFSTTLALILGKKRLEDIGIDSYYFVSWIEAYLDLLHKFRVYPASAKIIKWCAGYGDVNNESDPFRLISVRSQKNTSVRARFGIISAPNTYVRNLSGIQQSLSSGNLHREGSSGNLQRMLAAGGGRKSVESMKKDQAHFRCGVCMMQTKGETEFCPNCSASITQCGVCRLSVRGLYTWCQGCGHGGHVEHMQAWFLRATMCPTGCGHNCSFSMAPT